MKVITTVSIIFLIIIIFIQSFFMIKLYKATHWGYFEYVIEYAKNGSLYINGEFVTDKNVLIYDVKQYYYKDIFDSSPEDFKSSALPLTEIFKGLGFDVNWIDDNIAEISYEDKKYILNSEEFSIIGLQDEDNYNHIQDLYGGWGAGGTVLRRELILNQEHTQDTLFQMGIRNSIEIDYGKSIVNITIVE